MAHPFPSRVPRQDIAAARLRAATGAVDDAGDDGAGLDAADGGASLLPLDRAAPAVGRRGWSPRAAWWTFIDSGRRGLAAVVAIGLLAAVVSGAGYLRSRPRAFPVDRAPIGSTAVLTPSAVAGASPGAVASADAAPPSAGVAGPAAGTPSPAPSELVVDVAGRVRHPGIVRLPAGSRVADAVAAAGGPLPGARIGLLNLASPLSDGEQVVVGIETAAGAGGLVAGGQAIGGSGQPGPGASGPQQLVDVNTATVEQLDTLPRVGPVLAQRIVDFRTSHGAFHSVDELEQVPGIGPSTLADLRELVTV